MRSTVFRFNIILRTSDIEAYILDSKMNNISFDFRTYYIKDTPKDYSLTSQLRINNNDTIDFESIEDYCEGKCKYRYYIDGMYGYCGLVYIENHNLELAKRWVLLRKSEYYNVLVSGEFHLGRFLRTWPRYIIRGNKTTGIIRVNTKEITVADVDMRSGYPTYSEDDGFLFAVCKQDDSSGVECDSISGVKSVGRISSFYKIIENTTRKIVNLYCEKIFELRSVTYYGEITIDGLNVSFDDEVLLPVIKIHAENPIESYDKNRHKYGIITINTSLVGFLNGIYSKKNRIQINKGVQ